MTERNWGGNITYSAPSVHRPRTVDQVQELVAASRPVRALGTRHSFNRIADTTGALISVADLDVPIELDTAARTVTVGAGTRYATLAVELERQGFALHNLGSLPHISVAGACATGTHGSGDTNRSLASAVVGVEFVRADGTLVSVRADDPGFRGSVLALGALGIVTRLVLVVEPTYTVRQDAWLGVEHATLIERLPEIMGAGYSVSVFTDWASPASVLVKSRVRDAADAVADGSAWGARAATAPIHPIAGLDTVAVTDQLGRAGPWFERLPHFRPDFTPSRGEEQQSEFFVARADAAAAVAAVSRLEFGPVLQVCELRTVAADGLWLGPAHDRDSLALHFTWLDDDPAVADAVQAVQDAIAPFDPRPHWGKVFTPGAFTRPPAEHYPQLTDFRELIAEHDPEHAFGNAFLEQWIY